MENEDVKYQYEVSGILESGHSVRYLVFTIKEARKYTKSMQFWMIFKISPHRLVESDPALDN